MILDTPPLSAAADALFFGGRADECLVVAKWKSTPIDLVMGAAARLRAHGINVTGLVVCQAELAPARLGLYRPNAEAVTAPRPVEPVPVVITSDRRQPAPPPPG